MKLFSKMKGPGATVAGIFSLALGSVVLLCGAGSVPVENFAPQGAMQSDLNAGGNNLTNVGTVSATNAVISGTLTAANLGSAATNAASAFAPASGPFPWADATGAPPIQSPITLTTSGTSGAATFSSGTLNIPQYQDGVTSFNTRTGSVTLEASDLAISGAALTALPSNTSLYPTLNQNTTGSAGSVGTGTYLPYLTGGVPGAATSAEVQSVIGAGVYDASGAAAALLSTSSTWTGTQTFPAPLLLSGTNGTIQIGNGGWYTTGIGVPYFRPAQANSSGILDVLSNGTGGDSWIDIGTDYTEQSPNGQFLMLRYVNGSYGGITMKKLGSSAQLPLVIQDPNYGAGAKIGFLDTAPAEQFHFLYSQSGRTAIRVENDTSASNAYTQVSAQTGTATSQYIGIDALSSGWTTNGGFVAGAAALESGTGISAINIVPQASGATIGFYPHNSLALTIGTGTATFADVLASSAGISNTGTISTTGPLNSVAAQTSVAGSTSGTATFSEPFQGTSCKKVVIFENSLTGTASYVFPTAFTHMPLVINSDSTVTTNGTGTVTVTGSSSTGIVELEGY